MLGLRVLRPIAFLHQLGPNAAPCAKLGNLFEEVHVNIKEERQTFGKLFNVATAAVQFIHIRQAIGQGVGHFFSSRCAGISNVCARNADGIEARRFVVGIQNGICNEAHRGLHRKNPCASCHVLFQNIVLNGARQFGSGHALLVGNCQVHGVDDGSGAIDGERR